jgi:hypothetical protein
VSQSLENVPFPPIGFKFVDPKTGLLANAGATFLRSLWMRTGSATGGIPASQLPTGVATIPFVESAIAGATAGLAPITSPVFEGTPEAPTPTTGDNSTRLATTAYVQEQGYTTASFVNGAISAAVAPLATVTFVDSQIASATAGLAPLASPALTGTPTAPTPTAADSTTKIATTAYVKSQGYQTASNVAAAIAALPIVKSGSVSLGSVAAGGTGTGSVTFASPFPNVCNSVVVSASGSLLSTGGQPAALTGITYDYTSTNSGAATYTLYWVAVGS